MKLKAFRLSLFFIVLLGAPAAFPQSPSKDEVIAKHEKAIQLAEELDVYGQDVLNVMPKIRLATQALLRDDFGQAGRVLDEALEDLDLLESRRPKGVWKELKLEWLEIFFELAQKLLVLAFLGLLFARQRTFRRMLETGRPSAVWKMVIPLIACPLAILISWFDWTHYGATAWAFFDIQLVLIAISSLIGGFWPGLISGMLIALFRWFLNPEFLLYSGIALGSGILSGLFAYQAGSQRLSGKRSFLMGAGVGLLHGGAIYLPTFNLVSWTLIAFSMVLLSLLEGLGVWVFFAVASGVLNAARRREAEKELLKTKLLFLQAQMRPHFLFNALNTISAICGRERAAEAQHLILRLADFLRRTLKREEEMITLRDEISYIDSYLEIEKARLQDRLKVEKNFELRDDVWMTKIPILTLQPLVENAVQHGISKKESGGTVWINIREDDNHLKFHIKDDGPGTDSRAFQRIFTQEPSSSQGLGIALRNIHQRLVRLYGPSSGLQFKTAPDEGMEVSFQIPVIGKEGTA